MSEPIGITTPNYFATILTHLRKDLRIEWRSRDSINGMLFFSLMVVVMFSFAFDPAAEPDITRHTAGGILWVALLFAVVTALNQSWARELRNHVLDAQRLTAAAPSALFLGKVIANFLFVTIIEAVLAPVFYVFYNLHPLGQTSLLFAILPLGTWALIINGTFFAALSIRTRNRELLLPLTLFPITIPALIAMVGATSAVLTGDSDPGLWIRMLIGYDIIFTVVSILLFAPILHAD
jgi:heme exporter protein B